MRPHRRQDVDPGHLRHAHVGEHDVGGDRLDLLQAGLAALRGGHLERFVLEQDPQRIENRRLVVDDEDGGIGRAAHAASSFRRAAGK